MTLVWLCWHMAPCLVFRSVSRSPDRCNETRADPGMWLYQRSSVRKEVQVGLRTLFHPLNDVNEQFYTGDDGEPEYLSHICVVFPLLSSDPGSFWRTILFSMYQRWSMSWAADTCWPQSWSLDSLWTRLRACRRSWRTRWRLWRILLYSVCSRWELYFFRFCSIKCW